MVGMSPDSNSVPQDDWLKERYVYSAFMLNLEIVPPVFQGDFEDDIEYRMKLKQANIPSLEIVPFHYSKTAQDKHNGTEDTTGNREAYKQAGLSRGDTMSKLYGNIYSRGWSDQGSGIRRIKGQKKFRHKVKAFKVGVRVKDTNILKSEMIKLFAKYATARKDKLETNVDIPKYSFTFKISDDYFDNLGKMFKVLIKYGATLEQVKYRFEDYSKRIWKISLKSDYSKFLQLKTEILDFCKEVNEA